MSLCINEAWRYQTLTLPNPAVGAMIVGDNGEILALSAHQKSGTYHAEVNALKIAYEKLTSKKCIGQTPEEIHNFLEENHCGMFRGCSVFITLEPCNHYGKTPPCAKLLEDIRPKRVVVGSLEKTQAQGGINRLQEAGIEVIYGVEQKKCEDLLYPFLCLSQKGSFNLFKLAQRLNGDYKSGLISGKESREFTHNQRSIADKIIISGKTLRNDRPILDSRHANEMYSEKVTDVMVLSREDILDNTAPIFDVLDRKVMMSSEVLGLGLEDGFNVIEGGWELFESLESFIDMFLIHFSPTLRQNIFSKGFFWDGELLYTHKLGNDALLWIKKS
ncbi:riboflavin biosynthesis protein RibD [Helicobacter sp. 13S00477-4]|nr:riboflavin biosynthesis protein RibD [Helicobacter sp. 13S00477-4]